MEQSSIEWYAKQLAKIGLTDEVIGHLTKEAIEMHKQETIDSYTIGFTHNESGKSLRPLSYYNETFKSE